MYCQELGINPNRESNLRRFLEDETVFISLDGDIFIDSENEMEYYKDDLYYHNSFNVTDGATKDSLVDVPLYQHLEYLYN